MEGGSGGVTLLHVAEGVLVLKKQRLDDTTLGPGALGCLGRQRMKDPTAK